MGFPSALLSYLAGATARSLVVALLPLLLLLAFRVKAAAARHAVLFLTTAGMVAVAALNALLPPIPVPVLRTGVEASALPMPALPAPDVMVAGRPAPLPAAPPPAAPLAPVIFAALYLAGAAICLARLVFGALWTRRLFAASHAVESGLGSACFGSPVYECAWISVPLTLGWLRPRILLPNGWRNWERAKLEAVLVHEHNHIRRGDWAIALLAAVNRSLYWFNPLAWWLERRLATFAEQACDDAALLALGERESYAQALLDMAAAVRTGQGRLVWDAMAMAKGAEVRMRIERILDDNRQIPRDLTVLRWLALVGCSLPLIYFTAAVRPVAVRAQDQQTPAGIAERLQNRPNLTPGDAAQLEQYLAANPGDLAARERLITYYFSAGVREPRLIHTYWLITNHPESNEAAITSLGITPRATSFNTEADYEHAATLWRQQASAHPNDEAVLTHAGTFFAQPGGDPNEAERLFLQARALNPEGASGANHLAKLYATAILGTTGDPKFPNDNPDFGNRVRAQIENSTDRVLLMQTGNLLLGAAAPPLANGRPLPPGQLNLNEHPLLIPAQDLGRRLIEIGRPAGVPLRIFQRQTDAGQTQTILRGGQEQGAAGTLYQARPHPATPQDAFPQVQPLPSAPMPVSSTSPEYPVLARMARVQGTVTLGVVIGTDGHVTNLSVLRGHPLLVQAAMAAVQTWLYPQVAQPGSFEQDVTFTLPPGPPPQPLPADAPRKGSFGVEVQGGAVASNGAPQRIKVGGNVQASMLVKKVDPVYPAEAKAAGIQGTVTLDVIIAKDGTVESVTPVEGHPLLVAAAEAAVHQWVYKPTKLNNEPIEVSTTVTVPFELQQ